jgi:quinol-cytochrome oxidoreductase complex cytochrome b subunit
MNELGDFGVPEREIPLFPVLVVTLATVFAVLLGTGVWLLFEYRPGPDQSWGVTTLQSVHRIAGIAFIAVLAVLLGGLAFRARATRGRWGVAIGLVAFVLGSFVSVLAYRSGKLLAWDRLALWVVTRGQSIRGVVDLPETVRYVIVDGHSITPRSYDLLTVLHVGVLPLLAAVILLGMMWFRRRPRERPADLEVLPVS